MDGALEFGEVLDESVAKEYVTFNVYRIVITKI